MRPSPISAILAASAIMGGHSLANRALREMRPDPRLLGPIITRPPVKYRRRRRESTRARKLRLWKEGTCQMNQAWYLKRCLQHGHDPKPTVWSEHLPK